MSKKNKLTWLKVFLGVYLIIVFIYLLTCLIPFLDPGRFWFIAILGLVFPFLLLIMLVFLLIWIIRKSKWTFLSIISLLLSWQQISVLIGWNFNSSFNIDKAPGTIRVLSWNVSRWSESKLSMKNGGSYRELMFDYLREANADILCVQEFFECYDETLFKSNIPALEKLGYTYHYFVPSTKTYEDKFQFGLAIFSKYPLNNMAHISFKNGAHGEGISYADITINGKTYTIINIHLESFGFLGRYYDNGQLYGHSMIRALKHSYLLRSEQTKLIREIIKSSKFPVILCGDFDDIPNSYTYFNICTGLNDTFLNEGTYLGNTYNYILPNLRIDYILTDRRIQTTNFFSPNLPYSDHYPIIADLAINYMN